MNAATKFYGKYRGTVLNNVDPMMIGRVQVQCAEVLGVGISSWAMPCVPVAGKHSENSPRPFRIGGVIDRQGQHPHVGLSEPGDPARASRNAQKHPARLVEQHGTGDHCEYGRDGLQDARRFCPSRRGARGVALEQL